MQRTANPNLQAAHALLMLPDLFNFWLSGHKASEFTIASTSQCFNPYTRTWAVMAFDRTLGYLTQGIFSSQSCRLAACTGRLQPWLAAQSGSVSSCL